jgi:hypothetical protein
MQPMNYCTHAIEFFAKAQKISTLSTETKAWLRQLSTIMGRAPKFILPDGGRVLTDSLEMVPERIRLPYPEICIEYFVEQDTEFQPGFVPAAKRIIIAREIEAADLDPATYKAGFYNRDLGPFIMFTFVCSVPMGWGFGPAWCLISQDRRYSKLGGVNGAPIAAAAGFVAEDMDSWRRYVVVGGDRFSDFASADFVAEVPVILSLAQALSCANIAVETIPAPEKLNRARKFKGVTPFFDYHVLQVTAPGRRVSGSDHGGSHASPRTHLRRGHIRRLPKGNIWINSMVISGNAGPHGMIAKDYRIVRRMHG